MTGEENSKLGIHIRGFINELYLDDLRKKTMRGLEGQKLRGFSTGENLYGYCTQPVGELKVNKKGQAKYEGMVHKIDLDEADIVRRIYKEFIEGKSISKMVRKLNQDRIPTKRGYSGGWNTSSISRIPNNEKYMGLWIWRKSKNVRDWLQWWTRSQSIRTFGEITAHIKILPVHQPYLYQKLFKKVTQLRLLGMSYQQITKSLNTNKRTAVRAYRYGRR